MSDLSPPRFWVVAVVPVVSDDPEPDLRLFSSRGAAVSWVEDYFADLDISPLPAPASDSEFFTSWVVDDCCHIFVRLIPVDAER